MTLTQERLKELFSYNPETGVFIRRIATCNRVKSGSIAGSFSSQGYKQIRIDYKKYLSHRLAWLYVHGVWPINQIDHINHVKDDNRIANLRLATRSQNQWNQKKCYNNTSGYKGVCWQKQDKKWRAQIWVNGKCKNLGNYKDIKEAAKAYEKAAVKYHSEFACA